ncbi:MAG: aldehyde dehydrogenase family protein [Luteitalea sp.]|nr:aldehyde dehydrogenase family protein [Luteitalea sp.]
MRAVEYTQFYIGGRWQTPAGTDRILVQSPSTEETIGAVPAGIPEDVDRAAAAARAAFEGPWGQTTAAERAQWLGRLAGRLEAGRNAIAKVIAQEVGTPIRVATSIQAASPVTILRSYVDLLDTFPFEEQIGNSLIVREPVGVVGAITPWNYPLHQIAAKIGPALAAGCTIVLKPSEVAPLNACLLAEACHDIELPPGVINIVHGAGPSVGEAIVTHPAVAMVSFTGSVAAGRRVAVLAGERICKVTLELGGKSACVLLEDGPLEEAVAMCVKHAMLNSGQTCNAWTRLVVPRARLHEVEEVASATLGTLPLGDPLDPATRLGPLISAAQRDRVEHYLTAARQDGARLVAGGRRPPAFTKGHYVEPTVFSDVRSAMTIAQEEIFGPVLAVMPYDNEEEAVAIANETRYGLAGAVWSADPARALRVARRIRAGQVDINGGRYNPLAPFGGYKQSGIGREMGRFGLEEYLQVKALAQ